MKSFILFILLSTIVIANSFDVASNYYKKKEYKKAFNLFTKLAYNGNLNAQYNIGIMYYNGIGINEDKTLAFIWLSSSAKKGHRLAQNKLGFMYEKGIIPNMKSTKKAIKEYYKSANQNYEIAQLNLAMHYNQFIDKDSTKKALYWYTLAYKNGNMAATNNLASMYYFGQGTKVNYKKAAVLYTIAAKSNDMLAQYNLSMMYFSGEHFKRNPEKSYYWLKKSAINGYKIAQMKLAHFYREGNNLVNQNYKKSLYWYFKAAEQKHPPAQYYVGYSYYYGYGIKKDLKKAAYWLHLSSENGYKSAGSFMKRNKLYY